MTGKFEWLDDHVVQWIPDRFWPAHRAVSLLVDGQSTAFATGSKVVGVADISAHTFTVSIDGVDAGPPSALPAPHHRPHWGEDGDFRWVATGSAGLAVPAAQGHAVEESDTAIAAVPAGSTVAAAGA